MYISVSVVGRIFFALAQHLKTELCVLSIDVIKYKHTLFPSDISFKAFAIFWVSVTPSDNSFTISPHNLALLHSTQYL